MIPTTSNATRLHPLRPAPRLIAAAILVGIAIASQSGIAAVKVRAEFDKAFDFKAAHTWAWHPKSPGDLLVARTPEDDPVKIKQRAEPIILSAVEAEMPKHGLTKATAAPDVELTYYLLLTIGTWRQSAGQFLPPVSAWGIPPFAPGTTAIEAIEQGALVLDLSAKGQVVWRGIGEAQIKLTLDEAQRSALLREAVQKILEKYPPKK